jgi:DNA-binding NarL/FixJ family response regulator
VLTSREREILSLVCKGYSKFQIAEELYLSPNTVKAHIRSILGKFGLKNTKQIIIYCLKSQSDFSDDKL